MSCVGGVVISMKLARACLSVQLAGKRDTVSQTPSLFHFLTVIGESGDGAPSNRSIISSTIAGSFEGNMETWSPGSKESDSLPSVPSRRSTVDRLHEGEVIISMNVFPKN